MATSGVKKVQQRIFGTGVGEGTTGDMRTNDSIDVVATPVEAGSGGDGSGGGGANSNSPGAGLTVIIPKPKAPTPLPKKPTLDQSPKAGEKQGVSGGDGDAAAVDDIDGEDVDEEVDGGVSFRQRLAEKLGTEYNGAERYRLQQDDRREKHWKRWGPYLSDRQWVCLFFYHSDYY
jgi:hypothetical protein